MVASRCFRVFLFVPITFLFIIHPAYSQEKDLDKAETLNQKLTELDKQGRYQEAINLAQQVLTMREKVLGSDHPEVARGLDKLGELYQKIGDYSKAEPLHKRALAISEKALGPKHPDVAASLDNLGLLFHYLGDYTRAKPLHNRALVIREKALGPEHPDVATSLINLAALYVSLNDYTRAEPLFKRALAINEKALGPEHPDVATSLINLAFLYHSSGDYERAKLLYNRALTIRKKALGPEHPEVANILNNMAELYRNLGDYSLAKPLYKRALAIKEKALGSEHPDVATMLNNMAVLYVDLGDYSMAETLEKRALTIREKALGFEHPHVAYSLNNLATLYVDLGDYSMAEPLLKRSLAILEKALGPEHSLVAQSLNNLAELYSFLGDYSKADPLHKRALTIKERLLGSKHPQVAHSLNNLAALYCNLGDYAKAESLHKNALAIMEKALGPEHSDMATGLNNLAGFYVDLGDYSKAEPLYKHALAINEKALSPEHPKVATSLSNLAFLYQFLGDYAEAEPLFKRALSIREKALGSEHPDVAFSLSNLAVLYATLNDFQKANWLLTKAQRIDGKLIDQIIRFTTEEQKMKFLSMKQSGLYIFISLIDQYFSQEPSSRREVFDVWLGRKGIILEAQKRYQEALVYSDDPQVGKIFQELSRTRAKLSKLAFSGPGKIDPEVYKKKIADLESKKSELEAKLSRLSMAFALKQKISKADTLKVANALPKGTALLEFARVTKFNFKAKGKETPWLGDNYIAFVVHADRGEEPGMVNLGDAGEIDKAIALLKKQIVDSSDRKKPNMISASKKLYELVFEPLKKELGDVKEIFVSPDGNLSLIPFEVLLGPDGKFLIETYTFNYLAAGRDILRFGQIQKSDNKAVLMGNPDFNLGPKEKVSILEDLNLDDKKKFLQASRSASMGDFKFQPLEHTKEELAAIESILGQNKTEVYIGKEALEEVLMDKKAPIILHLATHGFFLKDQNTANIDSFNTGRGWQTAPLPEPGLSFPGGVASIIDIENPLLKSGVVLAGANHARETDNNDKNDGIVTAEEILGLNLHGTEMVVLSACDTGLGEVKSGEGVFGLRRAFTQAGAQSLVMSMWKVPDRETKELMVQFYENIYSGGMNRCQALRQAALNVMEVVRQRYGHADPRYWGAFVFMGEP
jgi:tetratricopeptide (TPR) repeat protein